MSDKVGKYNISENVNGNLIVNHESINQREIPVPEKPYIKVNGVWNVDQFPTRYVVEKEDGSLSMFTVTPFRSLHEKDFLTYKGYHPRKMKGSPMPIYLYKFYGLEKSDETANEVIHIRLTPSEKEKVQTAANGDSKTVSEFIRDYIKEL